MLVDIPSYPPFRFSAPARDATTFFIWTSHFRTLLGVLLLNPNLQPIIVTQCVFLIYFYYMGSDVSPSFCISSFVINLKMLWLGEIRYKKSDLKLIISLLIHFWPKRFLIHSSKWKMVLQCTFWWFLYNIMEEYILTVVYNLIMRFLIA